MKLEDIDIFYKRVLGRAADEAAKAYLLNANVGGVALIQSLIRSDEFFHKWLLDNHSLLIHEARLVAVGSLIPPGRKILDLGGANAPLHRMGYPHEFDRIVMVDLPQDARHEMYANIVIEDKLASGELIVHYGDMTKLDAFEDESFDLVWSGQSIEHVPLEAGERMCREAHRVLKSGGYFCLDTPNGAITSLHAATAGLDMIHPEHFIEFTVDHLCSVLKDAQFAIEKSYGIREMPTTYRDQKMDYCDFVRGAAVTDNVDASYIQFHICRKN